MNAAVSQAYRLRAVSDKGKAMSSRIWFAVVLFAAATAHAQQDYPNQPIKLIVPWPPGGGVGSSQHLAASMLIASTGASIVHVPYKGTSPAEADLVAGHISMMLDTTACLPFVSSGRMKALAVASKARNPALPNVPTFDEIGGGSPEDFAKFNLAEIARYADVVKASGAKVE